MAIKILLLVISVLSSIAAMPVNPSYVSPSGSGTSCTYISPCALSYANSNATAGNTVYLLGGSYSTNLQPSNSGSAGNVITFRAYTGETPIITNTGIALYISGKSYIKVWGITFQAPYQRPLLMNYGASYNEIAYCTFSGIPSVDNAKIWDGSTVGGTPCTNNWFHHNTFADQGSISETCNDYGGMQLGVPSYDSDSNYNTFEDNTFYHGGHHNLETFTKYNVIRNNFFYHHGSMAGSGCTYGPDSNGLYGNRNIQIYDGYSSDGTFNLIEVNRFGPSGPPSDDDGGDGMTITAPKNIFRYNSIYSAQNNGVLFKIGAGSYSDNNRFYNNTITGSGRYHNTGPQWQGYNLRWYRSTARCGQNNIVKNNIFYLYGGSADISAEDATCDPDIYVSNTVTNNFCTSTFTGKCSATGNPLFTDGSLPAITSTPTLLDPDLTLQSSSPAIDGGTYLTQANGSGSGSITLIVDDALYFQDGTWGSSLAKASAGLGGTFQADWIAIGTVTNVSQISSINYATNTITLVTALTWADDAPVWLYKNSNGTQVLQGPAPDYGAFEHLAIPVQPPEPPTIRIFMEGPESPYWLLYIWRYLFNGR